MSTQRKKTLRILRLRRKSRLITPGEPQKDKTRSNSIIVMAGWQRPPRSTNATVAAQRLVPRAAQSSSPPPPAVPAAGARAENGAGAESTQSKLRLLHFAQAYPPPLRPLPWPPPLPVPEPAPVLPDEPLPLLPPVDPCVEEEEDDDDLRRLLSGTRRPWPPLPWPPLGRSCVLGSAASWLALACASM